MKLFNVFSAREYDTARAGGPNGRQSPNGSLSGTNFHDDPNAAAEEVAMQNSHNHHCDTLSTSGLAFPSTSSVLMSPTVGRDPFYKRRNVVLYGTAAILIVVGIIAISTSVSGRGSSGSDSSNVSSGRNNDQPKRVQPTTNGPLVPAPEVPATALSTNKDAMGNVLVALYQSYGWDYSVLQAANTSQDNALTWVAGSARYSTDSPQTSLQRYSLACFYYATFMKENQFTNKPTDWISASKWLSSSSECEWEGVTCKSNSTIVEALELPGNAISGSIPVELALLGELVAIDLSQNYIYMQENDSNMDVFLYLPKLRSFIMDDNYFLTYNGFPEQFSALVALQKLQMSYNLLQGEVDGTLISSLQQLTHLEVESNYLSGSLPDELGKLSNLIYIYVRRNSLTLKLSEMFPAGSYQALFSLWIDSNVVTGSIPTTFGLLTDLASFSVTNTTLGGTIPTEMGLLSNLQRLWLYDNNLSGSLPTELNNLHILEVFEIHDNPQLKGSVPASICSSVAASSYGYKSVVVDCQNIACSCCSSCP